MSVVLNGCETRSPTLKEEHRQRVFGNRVLRRISGPNRDEVKGKRSRLHYEEIHKLYSSPNIRFGRADKEEWDVGDI